MNQSHDEPAHLPAGPAGIPDGCRATDAASKPGDLPVLRLSGPPDVVASVPALLGFHPAASSVVLGLSGPRSRASFVARADLPPPGYEEAQALVLSQAVRRSGADSSLVLAYTDDRGIALRSLGPLLAALQQVGAPPRDVLQVSEGTWWSLLCRDEGCCPPDGHPYDLSSSRITAEAVYAGIASLPDRQAIADMVAPPSGPALVVAQGVERQVRRELLVSAGRWRGGRRSAEQAGRRLVLDLLARRRADPSAAVTMVELTRLAVLLEHGCVRDQAYLRLDKHWLPAHVSLWREALQRVAPPLDAVPAALLAVSVWRSGGGALASIAAERAEASDPDHPAVRLARDLLAAGVPPSVWDEHLAGALAQAGGERD